MAPPLIGLCSLVLPLHGFTLHGCHVQERNAPYLPLGFIKLNKLGFRAKVPFTSKLSLRPAQVRSLIIDHSVPNL